MKTTFEKLCEGHYLSQTEAYQLFESMCQGKLNSSQISAIMTFFIARPIAADELNGFKNALLDACVPVKINRDVIDVCGTGGDKKDTFNISTLSALVLAASGVPVAKHGNYGSTSVSGSSDILNYLGYQFKDNSDDVNKELDQNGICFMHAPLFHPALKVVAIPRKELGVRTLFNMLGPLSNPARVSHRYIGVYGLDIARLYQYILQQSKEKYTIVHSLDGYDEVSLTDAFKCISATSERTIEPIDLGFKVQSQQSIFGGKTIKTASEIFVNVLKNESTDEQKNVVIANSALAMHTFNSALSIQDCIMQCSETIESKKTFELFKKLCS